MEIQVTVTGATPGDIATKLTAAAAAWGMNAIGTAAAPKKKTEKKTAPEPTEPANDETFGLEGASEETTEGDELLGFDAPAEETKPTQNKKKITEKDLNTAAMAYAKKHSRDAVLKIMKEQFKVKSVLEVKPEQYVAFMKAFAV